MLALSCHVVLSTIYDVAKEAEQMLLDFPASRTMS
jgi:hypothetical protein